MYDKSNCHGCKRSTEMETTFDTTELKLLAFMFNNSTLRDEETKETNEFLAQMGLSESEKAEVLKALRAKLESHK